jgi:hypothetical protein
VTVTNLMVSLQKPAVQLVGEKARRDDAYRTKLIKQPKAALEEVLGEKLPDGVTIVTHENTPTRLNVVLDPTLMAQAAANIGPAGPIEQVLKKAHGDSAFRKKLVADPRGTVYDAVGLEIPKGLEVKVFENTPDTLHLAIAAKPDASAELSEAELEQVAGGKLSQTQAAVATCSAIGGAVVVGCVFGAAFTFGITAGVSVVGAGTVAAGSAQQAGAIPTGGHSGPSIFPS